VKSFSDFISTAFSNTFLSTRITRPNINDRNAANKKVSQAIENMTGLEVEKVNVRIAGIAAEEQA